MEVNPDFLKLYGAARRLMRENAMGFRKVFDLEKWERWNQPGAGGRYCFCNNEIGLGHECFV